MRSLLPIALGHIAALGLSAASVAYGTMPERNLLQGATCLLLLLAAAMHLRPGPCSKMRIPIGCAGLALWPLAVPGMHGASLMLSLSMPLCGDAAASGTLAHAAAAILIHTAAMLLSAGAAAYLACRGKRLVRNLCAGARNPIPLSAQKNTSRSAPSGQP
ncbi:hypothetical protein ACIPEN_20560 [Herbaspirillum chlorophenolicum]|uniref:Transmembrane protein n=1 Tax=Herbaspirillum chlorophenolicum TaxID=211589 RepID=A0ABW8F4K2_9BURK